MFRILRQVFFSLEQNWNAIDLLNVVDRAVSGAEEAKLLLIASAVLTKTFRIVMHWHELPAALHSAAEHDSDNKSTRSSSRNRHDSISMILA